MCFTQISNGSTGTAQNLQAEHWFVLLREISCNSWIVS